MGFDFVLSFHVTSPLLTQVMGTSCACSFGKDCFDRLKNIGLKYLARLFSSSRDLIGSTLVDLCEI